MVPTPVVQLGKQFQRVNNRAQGEVPCSNHDFGVDRFRLFFPALPLADAVELADEVADHREVVAAR
jgi:hypothetical protein